MDYRPRFNNLLLFSEAGIVRVEFTTWYADGLLVMYHLVKFGDLDHFSLLLIFFFFGSEGANVAIRNQ